MSRASRFLIVVVLLLPARAPSATDPIDVVGYLRTHAEAVRSGFVRIKPTEVYGQSRTGLFTRIPDVIDVPVTVPAHARLRVGFALLDKFFGRDTLAGTEPTRFVVALVLPDGHEEPLVDRVLDPRGRPADRRWFDEGRDLSRFAGREGVLRLRTAIDGKPDAPGHNFALWSRPRLYDPEAERTRPNLLFITIDALRADHLGTYGYARATSPTLDRVAAEGVRFAHAFTDAPMTIPSLPQIFTSAVFPRADSPTLLSSLYAAGVVRCRAFLHNPYLQYWLTIQARDGFDAITGLDWKADHIVRAATKWLDEYGTERFALYLHFLDAHTPYVTPGAQATMFADPAYAGAIGATFADVEGAKQGRYAAADQAQVIALYDGGIHFIDEHIGVMLAHLEQMGVLDNTLIVVSADHGEELWDHGSFFHGQSLYDELLHVPLLIRFPGRAHAGTVVAPQVRSIDIGATIAAILGVPAFPEFDGQSLLPLIDGTEREGRPVFARAANPEFPYRFALRTPTHKLIVAVGSGTEELYDLVADPGERHDLSHDPAAGEVLTTMRSELRRLRLPLAASGFQIRAVARDGMARPIEVTARVSKGATLANPDRIGLPVSDRLALGADQRTLTWTGTVGPAPAGIRFDRVLTNEGGADPSLEVQVLVEGRDVPPGAILLGGAAQPAPTSPFSYTSPPEKIFFKATESLPLLSSVPPDLVPDPVEPVRVYVWRAPDVPSAAPPTPVDEESRRKLRALGYVQ